MKITITETDSCQVVSLCGELDTTASTQAEQELAPLFSRSDCDIVVDCSQLTYISSSGLRILLNIYKHVRKSGHRATLRGIDTDNAYYEALQLAGFFQLFDTE